MIRINAHAKKTIMKIDIIWYFTLNDCTKILKYFLFNLSKNFEKNPEFFVTFTKSAQWDGRIASASTNEKTKAKIAHKGIIDKKIPRVPSAKSIGNNEAILVKTVAITGQATSLAPIIAALAGSIPFCM